MCDANGSDVTEKQNAVHGGHGVETLSNHRARRMRQWRSYAIRTVLIVGFVAALWYAATQPHLH